MSFFLSFLFLLFSVSITLTWMILHLLLFATLWLFLISSSLIIFIYIYIYIYISTLAQWLKCSSNGPGDQGPIPGWVIPKSQKMVLDASLLNTQYYKVRIKGKLSNPGKGVVPSPTFQCSSYWKWAFGSPSTMISQLIYIYIYIYYIYTFLFLYFSI